MNGIEICAKGPPSIKGGVIRPSPLAGEGRERGILAFAKGADLNVAFYSSGGKSRGLCLGLVVAHTERGGTVRIVRARLVTAREKKDVKYSKKKNADELRPEYDFDYSKAVRGKYYRRLLDEGSNVVILDADVAKVFRDSASVNEALRSLLELTRSTKRLTSRSTGRAKKVQAG